ncbi:MAG: 3-deoxy-manno-octulosonate cytidylyltransferase [ANME-2 cluster archaeon]|nr:MAG: 3-deoxy-manno-octulosonate cytidylyltransferase [ANME-2 cluster archaeon]
MKIIAIIPARMGSSRFPGKPMANIHGMPMIGHVLLRSQMSELLDDVYVATCDKEIADYVKSIGGKAVMTSTCHERCTDRVAEALLSIEKDTNEKVDVVVNIQGDEPMLTPEMIDEAVKPMIANPSILCVNLMAPLKSQSEHEDPNEVKVVVDIDNFAMYFSREPIPSRKKGVTDVPMNKQVCIMPFTRDFLIRFNELEETPLGIIESVDMLRALEHGYKVKMVPTKYDTYSVDTPEDMKKVEQLMTDDGLRSKYI